MSSDCSSTSTGNWKLWLIITSQEGSVVNPHRLHHPNSQWDCAYASVRMYRSSWMCPPWLSCFFLSKAVFGHSQLDLNQRLQKRQALPDQLMIRSWSKHRNSWSGIKLRGLLGRTFEIECRWLGLHPLDLILCGTVCCSHWSASRSWSKVVELVLWGSELSKAARNYWYVQLSQVCRYSISLCWIGQNMSLVRNKGAKSWQWKCCGLEATSFKVGTWLIFRKSRCMRKAVRKQSLQFCIKEAEFLFLLIHSSLRSILCYWVNLLCQFGASNFRAWML